MGSQLETMDGRIARSAGFGKRLKAFGYDYLIIFVYIVLFAAVNYGLILAGGGLGKIVPQFRSVWIQDLIAFLTLILPVILYFSWQESSPAKATWGKRKLGLQVVDAEGGSLSKRMAFLRSFIKFLPWQIAHTSIYQISAVGFGDELPTISVIGFSLTYLLVGFYLVSAIVSKKHRTPYDWAAGAYVVYDFDELENYKNYRFIDPGILIDAELELGLVETRSYIPEKRFVPIYKFHMINFNTKAIMGYIDLRVGLIDNLKEFGGHIGYEVYDPYRGNRYAARSCRLLISLIRKLGINPLVFTCDPANIPSVKTIEYLGAIHVTTKEVEIEHNVFRPTSIYHLDTRL